MRSASVATGTRRPVRAPEPPSLPRVTRASWRRLPCALQEAPPSRRADDEPAVTRTWPLVWSRRGYIRVPPPHQHTHEDGGGWHPQWASRSRRTCSANAAPCPTPVEAVPDDGDGPCPMRARRGHFGAWCLLAVAVSQGRCPHPTSQPPTVYSRESDWARPQRGQRPQDAV